jgi:hypothetical protein
MRPRDLIEFFNNVVELASGKTALTKEMVVEGEGIYSRNRMRSLQDESQTQSVWRPAQQFIPCSSGC